jgi:DNA-binding NtrC family response regulator
VIEQYATPFLLPAEGVGLAKLLEQTEASLVLQALQRTGGNKAQAARLLRMNRTTFVEALRRHVRWGDGRLAAYWIGNPAEISTNATAGGVVP